MENNLEKFYQYYDMEINVCDGKRKEFLEAMKADLKPCKVVSVRELFTEEQVRIMESMVELKQCFKNAYNLADIMSHPDGHVTYVEGRVLVANFLPIEHAWNKVGDLYFDATFELCLGYDVTKELYASLAEYDVSHVRKVLFDRRYYGEIYRDEKAMEFAKKNKMI